MSFKGIIILLTGAIILGYGLDNFKMICVVPGICLTAVGMLILTEWRNKC